VAQRIRDKDQNSCMIDEKLLVVITCFCFSVIRNFDGSWVIKYRHPDAVYGCDWSPHNAYVICRCDLML